jgi:hypothetical protein
VSERDQRTRDWRRPSNEELHDLYCVPNFVRLIKSRKMRFVGHVERIAEKRSKFMWGFGRGLEGKKPLRKYTRRWEERRWGEGGS